MKTFFRQMVAVALPILPVWLHAQEIDTRRHIEVRGTARLFADVDRAIWHISIRGEANALEQASNQLSETITNLQEALEAGEFGKDPLRISGISSGRVYETQRNGPRVFKGYYAEQRAIIEIPDLKQREALERVLLSDDRIEIDRVDLKSTKHEELRKRSLISAVAAAKAKAEFLAREAGAELGVVLAIQEGVEARFGGHLTENRIEMPVFAQQEAPEFEKLSYSATVTVKFELR